jgi:hypothetical protein
MSQNVSITTALCISEADNTALSTGRSIAVLSRIFNTSGKCFALCFEGESIITAWAEIKSCKIYSDPGVAEALSWNTIWPKSFLQQLIEEKQRIFLNILRVHQFATPIFLDQLKVEAKIGGFIRLPTVLSTNATEPILSDFTFKERYERLENLKPSEHPELEELQASLNLYRRDTPAAQEFNDHIQRFLGWTTHNPKQNPLPDWIQQITTLGHRSEETEKKKKSHYQAGTDFEIIVRDAFKCLGFTMDESHHGKAGGIDAFCAKPYSIAIECKSGKSIPDNTVEELARIAKRHLKDNYESVIKLIVGPGSPTKQLSESATISKINIMQPKTLERLVKIKVLYPGSIDLLALEPCLRSEPFGTDADQKVNDFIDLIEKQIKTRSHVILKLKAILQDRKIKEVKFDIYSGYFYGSNPPEDITDRQLHDILIELSSPLTGYLGRIKGDTWRNDRFYYLRDLQVCN